MHSRVKLELADAWTAARRNNALRGQKMDCDVNRCERTGPDAAKRSVRSRPGRLVACLTLVWLAIATAARAQAPWLTNQPIVSVQSEVYLPQPQAGVGIWAKQYMAGPALERIEVTGLESTSDVGTNMQTRLSSDNGQTWSAFQALPDTTYTLGSATIYEGSDNAMPIFDSQAGVLIQPWLRQIHVGSLYHNFTYYRLSTDYGAAWSAPKQLKYEPGADFNPGNPQDPNFLNHNEAYIGQKFVTDSNGTLVMGVGHANDPSDPSNDQRAWRMGALDFIGTWNAAANDYEWTAGQRISISPTVSSRGLMETDTIELNDGRLLYVWRGSNTAQSAGHKWFSVSSDGGLTLNPVQEWKYDDGSSFYSPSSFHRLFRSQEDDKLYWIGNITPTAPSGNSPRYPLVIAEVDENLVALKKNTVTVIADRELGEPSGIQFSNFSLLENPETHQFEIFLTDFGADGTSLGGDALKYTITRLSDVLSDLDGDGHVNLDDYAILRGHWLQNVAPWSPNGDLNGDGVVDVFDFAIFKEDYIAANGGTGSELPGVPEPISLALAASAFVAGVLAAYGRLKCRF
jgi:Dockerin type I domain